MTIPGEGQPPTRVAHTAASDVGAEIPERGYRYLPVALLLIGVLVGWILTEALEPQPFTPVEGVGAFAVFYVAAQALERTFELLRMIFPAATSGLSGETKADLKSEARVHTASALSMLAARPGSDEVKQQAQIAADAKAKEEKAEATTSRIAWGVNSLLAAILSGWLGLYLLEYIGLTGIPLWLDIGVTSLVIGGGTKPLHDLIKNLEKSKQQKEESVAT